MNERSLWFRAAVILIAIAAGVYLVQSVSRLWGFMGDLIMIIFFGWLVGSVLIHFVNGLMNVPYMRRPIAIVLIYLALVTVVADLAFLVLPAAVNQLLDLVDEVPGYVDRVPEWLASVEIFAARFGIEIDLVSRYQITSADDIVANVTTFVADNAVTIAQTVVSAVFAIGLVIVLSFYVVLDGGRRLNEALKVLPPNAEREVRLVLRTFDDIFQGYIRGMLLVSLIYGVGTATVMMATGLPAALPSAIIASMLLAVPFIGDWLALALPLIVAALAGDLVTFLIVLSTLLFIQQVMLNLLTPRILGAAVRMPAGLVVVAVVLGARVAGLSGALLGVPAGAVIYSLAIIYGTRIRQRREAKERALTEQRQLAFDEAESDARGEVPEAPPVDFGPQEPPQRATQARRRDDKDRGTDALGGGMLPVPAGAQDDPGPTVEPEPPEEPATNKG